MKVESRNSKVENKQARVLANMELDREMALLQEALWKLRAKKKRLRIIEMERQIREVKK